MSRMKPMIGSAIEAVVGRRKVRRCQDITDEQVLAHEIRTPLSLIQGAAELLADEEDEGKRRRLVGTIQTNSARAIQIAESLLLQAKLHNGTYNLQKQAVDVRALLRETAQEMRAISQVPIVVDDPGDPLTVEADPQLLRHALWNVLNNAARYAGGDHDIVVHSEASATKVIITVADFGPGMSTKQRKQLFVPFSQFNTRGGNQRVPTGAGLGMVIMADIVGRHGGEVLVDSSADHGTSVLMTLPKGTMAGGEDDK